jgi:hypothetical protein
MMKKFFTSYLVICAFAAVAAAQSCPSITVTGPSSDVPAGSSLTFSVNATGGDQNVTPTFNWTVSAGIIASGQGTSVIEVDSTGAGDFITATVDLGGYDPTCSTSMSWTASISRRAEPRKIDEFTYLGPAKFEYERLDNIAIEMQNDPTSRLHVIFYLGRKGKPGAIAAWTGQTVNYLVKTRHIDNARITTADGGYRDNGQVELWIVPDGADQPMATPTVDPSEITPPKKPARKKS